MSELAKLLEALLFLSNEPVSLEELAAATDAWDDEVTTALAELEAVYDPAKLGGALAALQKPPAEVSLQHVTIHLVTVEQRLKVLRGLLKRGSILFDDAVKDADRVTVAVTIWALLELYKQGEAAWEQTEPFGAITVAAAAGTGAPARAEAVA